MDSVPQTLSQAVTCSSVADSSFSKLTPSLAVYTPPASTPLLHLPKEEHRLLDDLRFGIATFLFCGIPVYVTNLSISPCGHLSLLCFLIGTERSSQGAGGTFPYARHVKVPFLFALVILRDTVKKLVKKLGDLDSFVPNGKANLVKRCP